MRARRARSARRASRLRGCAGRRPRSSSRAWPPGRAAASRPSENASLLFVDRDAVQLDRAQQRRQADRHQAALPGVAQRQDVRRRSSRRGTPRPAPARRSVSTRSAPAAKRIFSSSAATFRLGVGVAQATRRPASRACWRGSACGRGARSAARRREAPTTRSQASSASACCVSMRTWFSARRRVGQAHERQHRAALLREAHEVEHARALAFQVRRHRDQRADRHDAGAADAGDQQVVRAGPARAARARQRVDAAHEARRAPAGQRAGASSAAPPTTPTKLGQKPLAQE